MSQQGITIVSITTFPPWLQVGKKWTQNNGTERINVTRVTQPNGDILITFDDASTLNITSTEFC